MIGLTSKMMENMFHSEATFCERCKTPMNVREFKTCILSYCLSCGAYKRSEPECEHDYKLILFELDNGSEQLRKYCPKCHSRDPKILSQKDYDLEQVRRRMENSYRTFYSELCKRENEDLGRLIDELRSKQEDVMFLDYNKYMTSDEWHKLRNMVVNRDGGVCQICGRQAEVVHHMTYAHFKTEFPFELISLCRECHHREYHSPDAKKRISELHKPANELT